MIFIVTLLVFIQARRFDFINYDDPLFITNNPYVQNGLTLHGIGWAWTTTYISYWQPITWMSHMLDISMFGLNAAGHHLTSVVIHSINAVLVCLVLRSLTRSFWKSAIVAGLFAVHPLRMESVAWVAERKDVLCATFYLLAIWAYGRYARSHRKRDYAVTILLFILGAASKPMIMTLPAVLLLLDLWPLRRSEAVGRLVVEKLPLFVISVLVGIITIIAQRAGKAVHTGEVPPAVRIGNAIWAYGRYLHKTFWPSNLAAFYPYVGLIPGTSFPWGRAVASGVIIVAITVIAILLWKRERAVLIGWLWFIGVLLPTIGLLQVGVQSMADRYTYLPQIGLFIALVWGAGALVTRYPPLRGLALTLSIASILILAISTMYQLQYWRNSETLFKHALAVTDHNAMAAASVGMYLSEHHRDPDAIPYYLQSLAIDPTDGSTHMNVANALAAQGDISAALQHANRAVDLMPKSGEAENNLANVLAQAGRTNEAIEHHRRAIALEPNLATAHYNYGITLAQAGKLREAATEFAKAVALQPNYVKARYAYGLALTQLNEHQAAVDQLRSALAYPMDSQLRSQIEQRLRQSTDQTHGGAVP